MYELCIKLELIKELYYDAQPNKSQDMSTELKTAPRSSLLNYAQSSEQWLCAVQNFLDTVFTSKLNQQIMYKKWYKDAAYKPFLHTSYYYLNEV